MASSALSNVRAIVSDIDGVLYHLGQPIPGAAEALSELHRRGYPLRFLTNITRRRRVSVARQLREMGLPVADREVLTASYLTASYLRRQGEKRRCWIVLDGDGLAEFEGIERAEDDAELVALGDMADKFTYELLNRILRVLWRGADFLAMQADPYDLTPLGPAVNVGGWLALLERAGGRRATLIGKPSPVAFRMALDEMGATPETAIMIGDRVGSDVAGGQSVGMRTVLVRTGHFRPQDLQGAVQPDVIVDSLAELPGVLAESAIER